MPVIEVTINGKSEQMPAPQTVASVLEYLQVAADRVAVELNRDLVRKRDWAQTPVLTGSALEIVEFVGGG